MYSNNFDNVLRNYRISSHFNRNRYGGGGVDHQLFLDHFFSVITITKFYLFYVCLGSFNKMMCHWDAGPLSAAPVIKKWGKKMTAIVYNVDTLYVTYLSNGSYNN